jgi:hypothetical protein
MSSSPYASHSSTKSHQNNYGDTWSLIDLSNTFVVIGSELVICHAEHPTVKKQISRDKALLVSIQRGYLNKRIDD